ncbi:MAG: dephospho-CoA kinase [Phycisphaerae bacterium]|nr:dephospho-CoA kinase [Phycisphaerae bacterium]
MGRGKPIIGLCGGIGAGKSRVAAEFERLGCLVIDSDRMNHEVLRLPEVLQTLRDWWGEDLVDEAGEPNRERLAEIVFDAPEQKRRLEGLVYPLIARRRKAMIIAVEDNSAHKAIVIDSPLLFESNLDRECSTVVFVDASAARRMRRLRESRGWDAEELRRRERWQITLDEKRSRAEFVVHNDGLAEQIGSQVAGILQKIMARHSVSE